MVHDHGVGVCLAEFVAITEERYLLGVLGVTKVFQHLEPVSDGFAVLLLDGGKECASVA